MSILKQITVENFKSWRGKQVIGPFMGFSCIIGTNGSGKSNVMDAVSFAIGARVTSLRVSHHTDLIHGAHIGQPVSESAFVALQCEDHLGQEIVFRRSISGDSSQYHISGAPVTRSKYDQELRKLGIVSKAQNCLVFQGAVQSIALKNPKERTKMFEFICQSSELIAEYNKKKEALNKATEDTQFQFNQRKSVSGEKKKVFEERLEAQKYQVLVDELAQKRLQLRLAELYHNEKAIESTRQTLSDKQEAASAQNASVLDWEQNVKTHKKEHGHLVREQQHMEKEICAQEHILAQSQSQFIKAKVSSSHQLKKREELKRALKKSQKLLALKEQEIAENQQEKADLKKTWIIYENQFQEQKQSQEMDIELDEMQQERYKNLKELARRQSAVLGQQAEKLHWEVKADYEKVKFDERKRKEGEAGVKNNKSQLEDLTRRAEKLEEYTKTCKSSLERSRQEEEHLQAELQHGRQRSTEVNLELGQVLEELRIAGLENQENKYQLQRKEMLDKLRRLFPESVYGRLCDLCSPIHKKYQLAVTKVFGHYLKAIVVTTEKVARDCICFLKEERADPETFLPIDYLNVSPLNERLRNVSGAKMMVDVVTTSAPQLRRVVQFVCGNAMVCETLKEARSVAFDRTERVKTVSLDGTLFAKSGVISGGSSDLKAKARCWDEKDVTKLKERKERMSAELRDLMRLKRRESDLKQIVAETQGVQVRLKYSKIELDNLLKKNIPKCQGDISRMESELANLDSEIQMQLESVVARESAMKDLRDQIKQTEDSVFSDFCADIGVDNIRVFEQEQLKRQDEHDMKRLEFESQLTRLNVKLEYEREQLEKQKKKLGETQTSIDKEESVIAERRKDEEKLLGAVKEVDQNLQEMNNQLLAKKGQVATLKSELEEKILRLQEIKRGLVKRQGEVMCVESSLEQKQLARHNLLLACKINDLSITMLSGNLEEISEVQLDTESEGTSVTMNIFEREAELVVDYSCLDAQIRDVRAEEVDAKIERLRESVYSIEEELHQTITPNLKAVEKMKQLKDKLQGLTDALNTTARVVKKCNQEFEQVKMRRLQLFNQCFNHVSVVIDQIYKKICQNSGVQAILIPENPDEPYLGGITYSCVAPGKRFMSMENLSGGEKAIAALALVFAVYSFRPAPFLMLDEVDAALDNSNIGKVTRFIKEESIMRKMQFIVISLKEEFFHKADGLLGVYSDFDEQTFSRILTLDLQPYPLPEDDNEANGEQPTGI
ncbi:structural maintenance of chromosomes protein 1B isoform X1 [Entelurus aequoreus]|uniref:structural maintenance of chromosomes protein 1B isoform X1 n=1 Tax=Entelurus aequoreus TaxID=161455 RepID=UPI002B1DE53B|nr:structural maintenance of chromosomes protein 1B isoform X1 [Entelurus aequoreus]